MDRFGRDEVLFRRFRKNQLVNGELTPAALQFPKTAAEGGHSVNRSRFSEPEDVLWVGQDRVEGFGIFQFAVSVIPPDVTCPDTHARYAFFPKHVPLEDNYAHSEIWCDHMPRENAGYVIPSNRVKKELRAKISKYSQIIRQAEI